MSDRYLWDKTGKPDPEIERLERAMSRLAHHDRPLTLPDAMPQPARATRRRPVLSRPFAWGFAAAMLLAVLGGVLWLSLGRSDWRATQIAGAPRVGGEGVDGGHSHLGEAETRVVRPGDWLVTDTASSLQLTLGRIGLVEVGPNSRVQVRGVRAPDQRLALMRGSLQAVVLAPPRQFFVETPSATAVDLGCAYSLEVDVAGAATLTVIAGWVSFEHQGRETFVPAGARCVTRVTTGPGTPYFTDAAPALKNALALVDLDPADVPDSALAALIDGARPEDAFTLWHLIERLSGADRAVVVDRLTTLVPPPEGVTRDGVLRADRAMLEQWWNRLGFGEAADWRRWRDAGQVTH